jgi:serine/threonine-protein kinase
MLELPHALVDVLREADLLTPAQADELVMSVAHQFVDAGELADDLVRRRWLTRYQADVLLRGNAPQLVLGPYALLEPLGSGAVAQVFRARHRPLGRVDAVKVIRPQYAAVPDALECFRQEARALARLSHPNIVIVHDAGEVAGRHFVALEYIEGEDLSRLVRRFGPLPVATACDYARQAALALQHACERGVVHRDVKPHNLRLEADTGRVKLLDLGLARAPGVEAACGSAGRLMGTPDYVAPEQCIAGAEVDCRADVYSLGCTLYFLLTGRPPFPDGSAEEKLRCHHREPPPDVRSRRDDVPPALAAALARMMAKAPVERYQSPGGVAEVLVPYCPGGKAVPALTL